MTKEQAKEGLNNLGAFIRNYDFESLLIEESGQLQMDSLVIPLQIAEDLSIDISCNYFEMPDPGNMLQFYGQFSLDELMRAHKISEYDLLRLANEINPRIPVGQMFYLPPDPDTAAGAAFGIRYTMLTRLDETAELEKCVSVLMILMQMYEFLCSVLLLLADGKPADEAIQIVDDILKL